MLGFFPGVKLLVYSDLQADVSHEMCFNAPDVHLQIHRVRTFYRVLKEVFDAYRCDGLVDLGDTFDDRTSLHYRALDAVLEGLSLFPASDLNIKLQGNHEQHLRDCSLDLRRLFEPRFTVVSQAEVIKLTEDTHFFCAAYPASDEALHGWLHAEAHRYREVPVRILLGHFQVVGSQMTSGSAVTGIPAKALRPFTTVLLGHVHRPQTIGSNAHYVGSPFQQNFGEKNEAKRVAILDTESGAVDWQPLEGFPEYRVCDFQEFVRLARPEDEHRYQVYVRSAEEAEQYYAHPLMNRAEAIYDYQIKPDTKTESLTALTLEAVMQRYATLHPAESFATSDALLDYGLSIAQSD